MSANQFCHELSPLFAEARETFRVVAALARSHSGWVNRDVRRYASRLLEHSTAACDAPSSALRTQSLRYAKMSALKLCAAAEAGLLDEQLSEEAYRRVRGCMARVLAALRLRLPSETAVEDAPSEPPSTTASEPSADLKSVENHEGTPQRPEPFVLLESVPAAGTS